MRDIGRLIPFLCIVGVFASYVRARILIKRLQHVDDVTRRNQKIEDIRKIDVSVRIVLVIIAIIAMVLWQ